MSGIEDVKEVLAWWPFTSWVFIREVLGKLWVFV